MLSEKLEKALNEQINAEFWSAYLYLSMSVHFESTGLTGFSGWFRSQFAEEQGHAAKIIQYIIARGGKVNLKFIDKVETSWKSPLSAFEDTLKHEKSVTKSIHNLVELARDEKDVATESFLKYFVDEQVEEEATATGIIDALKFVDGDKIGIFMLNKELGARK